MGCPIGNVQERWGQFKTPVVNAFWLFDEARLKTFQQRFPSGFPADFLEFTARNNLKDKKRGQQRWEQEELKKHTDALFDFIQINWMRGSIWQPWRERLIQLATSMSAFRDSLLSMPRQSLTAAQRQNPPPRRQQLADDAFGRLADRQCEVKSVVASC